mgnify:CR=1 FL=1
MNITASLQIKRGIYQVVLSYKDNLNKRKQKWISTGLSIKGNNKRLAKYLYSLGFEKESRFDEKQNEYWLFERSQDLQKSLDFFFENTFFN